VPVPPASMTVVCGWTATLGVCSIRSMRYRDIDLAEPVAQRHDVNLSGEAGEEQRRLSRRVAAAEDVDLLAAACGRLDGGRPVVHARADQRGAPGASSHRNETPIARMTVCAAELGPVVQRHAALQVIAAQTVARRVTTISTPNRSDCSTVRRRGRCRRGRSEAGIVLDHGAVARLPARDILLDDDRAKSLRSSVDRRRQAGRSSADDDEVVQRRRGPSADRAARPTSRYRDRSGPRHRAGSRSGTSGRRPCFGEDPR
jgi:hypothetical protein